MSELERGMVAIIQVFHNYSGQKCKLKKAELKELINNEMSTFIKHPPTIISLIFNEHFNFTNGDLEIDFKEFITLIAMVTSACKFLYLQKHKKSFW
uniref:S100/CaBP-9k-type calcium binding subdomain domain-containing protein n=1 Tax=Mola mola TaxID=94237 RepID=A0A3Q3VRE4_MOLML